MKRLVLYDRDRYLLRREDNIVDRGYTRCEVEEMLSLEDRYTGIQYRGCIQDENTAKTLSFLELAGGIYLEPVDNAVIYTMNRTLYSNNISGNYIHIEYDGVTHITIENRDYIYRYNIPYYADIETKYEENICLFLIKYCDYIRIIVLKCDEDYIELLNTQGNEVRIEENCIIIVRKYEDSLGRISTAEYKLDEGRYICTNIRFEYTYSMVYGDDVRCLLLEDAVVAHDYEYIRSHMREDVSIDDIREYFMSILNDDIHTLRCEDISDTMHFVVTHCYRPYIVDIHVCFDKEGKITNLEEVNHV